MNQTTNNAGATLAQVPQRNNLGYKDLLRLVTRIGQDTDWIKAEQPTYDVLVERYKNLIPGKAITRRAIRGVIEQAELGQFIRRKYGSGTNGTFTAAAFRRLNALAVVVSRVAQEMGVSYEELNWDYLSGPTSVPEVSAEERLLA